MRIFSAVDAIRICKGCRTAVGRRGNFLKLFFFFKTNVILPGQLFFKITFCSLLISAISFAIFISLTKTGKGFAFCLFLILKIFLKFTISFWLLILTGTLIVASFIYPLVAGSLQGMKKFSTLGWNTLLVFFIKIIIAIILVIFGFKVYGAILGFILGMIFGFIFALPYIKEIINAKRDDDGTKILTKENSLIFCAILVFVFMYSIDVILARVFFSSEIAGQYAVLSTIGKMILFSTMPIGNAMFPISAERHYAKTKTSGIIKKASLYVFMLCATAIAIFIIFPELIIKLLFGNHAPPGIKISPRMERCSNKTRART